METRSSFSIPPALFALKPSLVEWKLLHLPAKHFFAGGFETFLSGMETGTVSVELKYMNNP